MKKLLSFAAVCLFSAVAFATGPLPLNSQLTGSVTFTNGGSQYVTNLFEPPFSYAPAFNMYLVSANTNALPLTSTVTPTNYIIQISSTAGAGTNATVVWIANPVATRVQYGNLIAASPTTTNIVFATPFVYTPTVVAVGSITNVLITAITLTNFTAVSGGLSNTVYWTAVGPCATRAATGPASTDGVLTY
jgi:hypothetical protein